MTGDEAMALLDIAELFDMSAAAMLLHGDDERHAGMAGAFMACAWRLRGHVTDKVQVDA